MILLLNRICCLLRGHDWHDPFARHSGRPPYFKSISQCRRCGKFHFNAFD